jgi:hypothetical protein
LVAEVAQALARLGQRGYATGPDDPVFPGDSAGHLDVSALRRRFVAARDAAGLRPLRFHDLRHTFGSLAINRASIVQVQAWMGHADAKTTMRYLHHKSQLNEAELLADAFRPTAAQSDDWVDGAAERVGPVARSLTDLASRRSPVRSRLAPSESACRKGSSVTVVLNARHDLFHGCVPCAPKRDATIGGRLSELSASGPDVAARWIVDG